MDKIEFERTFKKEEWHTYFSFAFEMPADTESFDIAYTTDPKGKYIDLDLIGPDGKQVGASCTNTKKVRVSERYCTPGYSIEEIEPGRWQLVLGYNEYTERDLKVEVSITFTKKQPRWLKGDPHLHTCHSDGKYSPLTILKKCRKAGMEWAIITDHNVNTGGGVRLGDPEFLSIQGIELTNYKGHVNFWGIKKPYDAPYCFSDYKDFLAIAEEGRRRGATVSINHHTCKKCGWRMPLDGFKFDCVEVWNSQMRVDNMSAVKWWHEQLLKGSRTGAVGGSDYHEDFVVTRLLGQPTTVVYAKSNTTSDILKALRDGSSFITHSSKSTMLYLTCGDKNVGETVKFEKGVKVKIAADKLKRGHTLKLYNNDKVIYTYKAKRTKKHIAEVQVEEKGFVRAEIIFRKNAVGRLIHKLIMLFLLPQDAKLPVPPFIWALTNPIYFE